MPLLLDEHLVLELVGTDQLRDLELETARGGLQWMTTIEVIFRLTHAPTGHSEVYRVPGRRTNDKDKGVQHAISSAGKTLLIRLLATWESSEAPATPPQQSTGSRGRQQRQAQPRSEPEPEGGANGVTQPRMSNAERLQLAKDDLKGLMREQHLKMYHVEAVAQSDRQFPDELEEFGVTDWERMREIARGKPDTFERAMVNMAGEFPSAPDRLRLLHDLLQRPGANPTSEETLLTASAHAANWNDAVEYWIDILMKRTQQVEAGV